MKDTGRFAGCVAVIGAVIAWCVVPFYLAATHFNVDLMNHPAAALALSARSQSLYGGSMWADVLGTYLPFIVIGGYLWSRMRPATGAMADIAVLAILAYAIFGVVGASKLIPTLAPLSTLHASGDPAAKAAAEASWLALSAAAQGAWTVEGAVFVLWGAVTAGFLRTQKWGFSALLKVDVALFGILFLLRLVNWPVFAGIEALLVVAMHAIHPLWMLLFGISVLRGHAPAALSVEAIAQAH
jgi:hypothetical protein